MPHPFPWSFTELSKKGGLRITSYGKKSLVKHTHIEFRAGYKCSGKTESGKGSWKIQHAAATWGRCGTPPVDTLYPGLEGLLRWVSRDGWYPGRRLNARLPKGCLFWWVFVIFLSYPQLFPRVQSCGEFLSMTIGERTDLAVRWSGSTVENLQKTCSVWESNLCFLSDTVWC